MTLSKEQQERKKYFEANYLDGDKVEDCGGAMLSAPDVLEAIEDCVSLALAAREKERDEQFLATNIPALIQTMQEDAELYGQLHNDNCPVNSEYDCDCENMEVIKAFAREWMGKVNEWWVVNAQAHRKHCSPEGNKTLTRLMGRKNRSFLRSQKEDKPKE